jgi:Zn-finger nucleic acid-binding protein
MKKKRVLDTFLIDRCPECQGMWFDKGELRVVQGAAKQRGREEVFRRGVWAAIFGVDGEDLINE